MTGYLLSTVILSVIAWVLPAVVRRCIPLRRMMLGVICLPILVIFAAAVVWVFEAMGIALPFYDMNEQGAFLATATKLSIGVCLIMALRISQMKERAE